MTPRLTSVLAVAVLVLTARATEFDTRLEIRGEAVEANCDLGTARANTTVPFMWRIANLTERTVNLGELKASCPCLSAITYSARTLGPKEEATITARWYVGPAHGTELVRVTIPITSGVAPAGHIAIKASIAVTDLIDIDEGARVCALGKFTAEAAGQVTISPVAFRRAMLRPWDEVYVKSNDTFASMMIRQTDIGAYEIVFDDIELNKLKARPFGLFSETFTLGFRSNGRDLVETVRYRLGGHFAHSTYSLSPAQLYWGTISAEGGGVLSRHVRRSAVMGFVPHSVAFLRTTYVYNDMESSDMAQPFEVTLNNSAIEVRLAAVVPKFSKRVDKGSSLYIVEGTNGGSTVQYFLPIFFSIPE